MRPDYAEAIFDRLGGLADLSEATRREVARVAAEVVAEDAYYHWVSKREANEVLRRAVDAGLQRDRALVVVGRLTTILGSAGLLTADPTSGDVPVPRLLEFGRAGAAEAGRFWGEAIPFQRDPEVAHDWARLALAASDLRDALEAVLEGVDHVDAAGSEDPAFARARAVLEATRSE